MESARKLKSFGWTSQRGRPVSPLHFLHHLSQTQKANSVPSRTLPDARKCHTANYVALARQVSRWSSSGCCFQSGT